MDIENVMQTARPEEGLEPGTITETQEVGHMYSKLHAVYGVWIVQREGLH